MKKIVSFILALSMLASVPFTMTGCNTGAYREKGGIILANEGNTKMLGRTYVANFKKLDSQDLDGDGTKMVKHEEVMFFNWPASGFEISFNGTGIKAQILSEAAPYDDEGPVVVYAMVDGKEEPTEAKAIELNQIDGWYTLCEGLEKGEHTVKVVRRDSNSVPDGKRATAIRAYDVLGGNSMNEKPAARKYKIEAYGDSITCGDELWLLGFNEDGTRRSMADGWQTYAAYTSRQFNADLNVISISGNGLICCLMGFKLYELPDRFYNTDEFNTAKKNDWDHSKYQADLVLINLGTNDRGGVPSNFTYQEYEDAYVDFCTNIKTAYPNCHIIGIMGMMGLDGEGKMFPAIENAAKRINDKFGEGTMYTLNLEVEGIRDDPVEGGGHPSIEAQAKAGEYVCKLVEEKLGWERAERYKK